MTPTSFKIKNHPQQVEKCGARDDVDDRTTPDSLWLPLHNEFGFTLDAAASDINHKLSKYLTREKNSLRSSWGGERVWCNPPYSDCLSFVAKAISEVRDNGCELVVLLVPANRTEQGWWQDYVEPVRDRGLGIETRFVRGRVSFGYTPERRIIQKPGSPPFGVVLIIIDAKIRKQSEQKDLFSREQC